VEVAGIQLKSIDVNPAQNAIVVELDAANDGALGDYLDRLNAGQDVPKWHIAKLAAASTGQRTDATVNRGSFAEAGHSVSIVRTLKSAQP